MHVHILMCACVCVRMCACIRANVCMYVHMYVVIIIAKKVTTIIRTEHMYLSWFIAIHVVPIHQCFLTWNLEYK